MYYRMENYLMIQFSKIIETYTDKRIRLEKRNSAFIKNLNEGLAIAQGEYIARMDADDIMHTERLRIQLKRMKQNPDIVLCASWVKNFNTNGEPLPETNIGENYVIQPILQMLKGNYIAHPSVMLKKSFLKTHHLAYQNYPCAEDFKLWFEIAKNGGEIFIEPQHLMSLRRSASQITVVKREDMLKQTIRIKQEVVEYLLDSIKKCRSYRKLYNNLSETAKEGLIPWNLVFQIFYNIIFKKIDS